MLLEKVLLNYRWRSRASRTSFSGLEYVTLFGILKMNDVTDYSIEGSADKIKFC